MDRDPLTKQRSDWNERPDITEAIRERGLAEPDAVAFTRNVHDGQLRAIVGTIPGDGLHLSISHSPHNKNRPARYPTWDEIAHCREALTPPDREFIMVLPVASDYVAVHPTTFHIHEALRPAETYLSGVRFRVLLGTDDEDKVVTDDEGRVVARLEPAAVDLQDDTYTARLAVAEDEE